MRRMLGSLVMFLVGRGLVPMSPSPRDRHEGKAINADTQPPEALATRIVRFTLLSLLIAFGLFTPLSAPTARATTARVTVPAGRACIINAPDSVLPGGLIGHVGWAYKDGAGDSWEFGVTPSNFDSTLHTINWSNGGTWYGLVSSFESRSGLDDPNHYTQYRCINVANGNGSAAYAAEQQQAASGYNLGNNNCLTKAVAILKAYGVTNLPPAWNVGPNWYFQNQLTGFEWTRPLPALLGIMVMLNDPVNGQPINTHPLHPYRPMYVQIYNASNQLVFNQQSTATHYSVAGNDLYRANIVLGSYWTSGYYQVKVRLNYTLRKLVQGISTINSLQNTVLPLRPLIPGDVNQDNQLDLQDYNLLIAAYGSTQGDSRYNQGADVNDDGVVDGIDYNLWLRIYSTHPSVG